MSARQLPKVLLGGPAHNRAWSVPAWLGSLLGQRYPRDLLSLGVLVNDSRDRTLEACQVWGDMARREGCRRVVVERHDLGVTVDQTVRDKSRNLPAFATMRDAWVALRDDEEWLLQVDSDVQLPADTLAKLLRRALDHDVKMLAAVIPNNVGAAMHYTNVLDYREVSDGRTILTWARDVWYDRTDRVRPCAMTGAAVLLHRSIFDTGFRYASDLVPEVGEDKPFCDALSAAGIQPHCAPAIRATHWMQAPEDVSYVDDPGYHRRRAAYHAAMADLLEYHDGEAA